MKHKIEIAPNLAIVIDGERVIGSKPRGLFLTTEMIVSDEDLKRLADRCLEVISDSKTEPQTERIKTYDYCDICNHKRCENCIANSLDDYCVPSGYEPITKTETQNSNLTFEKDECAKEYEELGLKELKELIEADRKTESRPTQTNADQRIQDVESVEPMQTEREGK